LHDVVNGLYNLKCIIFVSGCQFNAIAYCIFVAKM